MLEVIPVGSTVRLDGAIDGRIVQISIKAEGCMYQVAWWSGSERRCEWVEPFEIEFVGERVRLGFR